jgi:small basic protein (TIGR04137 family)
MAIASGQSFATHTASTGPAGTILHLRAMSQHSSLRSAGTTAAKRNVLKRFERVALLKSRNQWKDGDRVTGLRKTRPAE